MDESEENMSAEDIQGVDSPTSVKIKPKKRSLVERELETNLTARVTSPVTNDGTSTSRYGRARRLKTGLDIDLEKVMKPLKIDVSKTPQAYKMHASNSPIRKESPKRVVSVGTHIGDQIENIYNENISLSRFGSEEKAKAQSPAKKFSKVYIRKDLIQKPDTDTVVLIKNMFSPTKPNSHLNNILERSSEKYNLNGLGKSWNGFPDTSSVVKTLDFDGKKKKRGEDGVKSKKKSEDDIKSEKRSEDGVKSKKKSEDDTKSKKGSEDEGKILKKSEDDEKIQKNIIDDAKIKKKSEEDGKTKKILSKNELFELEASCEYQVGDLAWARVGTYPFWPCIVTREPFSDMFVKKKLFGRVERSVVHVTFFGDNGRRGWIVDNMLRKYHGRAEFEAAREKFTPEDKKKDPRLYAAHFVSEKKLTLWNVSVDEAETLMKEPKRLRIDILYDMLEKCRAAKTTPKREKGGKITRTDSDVSLSESLYDTLFSEDDGKNDDGNRSKRARNKSLDVSEVVTACLDNMAAKSGIIQIQRQSHMDRWLQKAKSKTPEKIQPKIQIKLKKEKRKDKEKRDSRKPRKLRKNESLSSDANLLPYQNEHDYSSVNYENHNINDRSNNSNKNTDSASGHDSTLDTSGIDVIVKVESLSSSMDESSQDDIITTVVNDDFVMTEPENISKDATGDESTNTDNTNDKIENNNEYSLEVSKVNENDQIDVTLETALNNSSNNNDVQPRRSKRKRQTFEGLNNSVTENKVKEPKLDLAEEKPDTSAKSSLADNDTAENTLEPKDAIITETENQENDSKSSSLKEPTIIQLVKETSNEITFNTKDFMAFNSNIKPVVVIEPLKLDSLVTRTKSKFKWLVRKKVLRSAIKKDSTVKENDESPVVSSNVDPKQSYSKLEETAANESLDDTHDSVTNEAVKTNIALVSLTQFEDVSPEKDPDISKDKVQQISECSIDSEKIEFNNSEEHLTPVVVVQAERINNSSAVTMISTTGPDPTAPPEIEIKNKAVEVNLTSAQENEKILNKNQVPSVVIGEETYIFDRTLSQDYDEVDGDRCDELINSPDDTCVKEENVTNALENDVGDSDDTISQDKTSDKETADSTLSSKNDDLLSNDDSESLNISNATDSKEIVTSEREDKSSDLSDNNKTSNEFYGGDGGTIHNNKIETIEDDQSSLKKSDVDSTTNVEQSQVPNQKVEENKSQGVFLGNSLILASAQYNDQNASKENTKKPLRFSLKRNRNNSSTSKKCDDSHNSSTESVDESLKNVNPDTKLNDHINESLNSDNTKRSSQLKSQPDATMSDPEFVKYLEIRQDALIEEHPDLSQEEIVTYLYKNWLYEEGNKSDMKKTDDAEQYAVKGLQQEPARPVPQVQKIKLIRKRPKVDKPELKNADIRNMMQPRRPEVNSVDTKLDSLESTNNEANISTDTQNMAPSGEIDNLKNKANGDNDSPSGEIDNLKHKANDDNDSISINKSDNIDDSSAEICKSDTEANKNLENNESKNQPILSVENDILTDPKSEGASKDKNTLRDIDSKASISSTEETGDFTIISGQDKDEVISENLDISLVAPVIENGVENGDIEKPNELIDSTTSENLESVTDDFDNDTNNLDEDVSDKGTKKFDTPTINGVIESNEFPSESKANEEFDPETASLRSEDSGVSIAKRKGRPKEKQDSKKATDDPEFIKYLEARQDALIEEQPDLTHEEIVTYLYQTWFYEQSTKSDIKKTDETEQSNLVKGLNQKPAPPPRKYKKKPKVEKDPELKNVDIRSMMPKEKPKRKATQSKPYYNEDDSDLEEEDLETFKIFDRDEQNENGEEIDEVELYFEQLTKPKPNVFKGYVRERVCEICEKTGNLVKCKSCHGTFHVDCVKKEVEVIEVAAPTRGRKKKRGRRPKGYDPLLDSGSQSDERSQDANISEEMNISIEEEAESHLVYDADTFEQQFELNMKEIQPLNQEYISDQEISWNVKPGLCQIVDVKQKEKPIDYSDYKCNNCLKYDTPICFVCKSNKSPKSQTEIRQKCQVAHCHRYYHLECLDHWPQTQFNSWELSKTNKKEIEYIEALTCPRHVCHTCVSDDPRGCKTRFSGDKLARCVKCPATYHSYTKCLPAGTQILTGSQIICPRHYEHRPGKVPCHVNTGWCFICALGGTLICCEYCPTSFHAECLNIKPPEGSYMCEDCETGRLPLYGEMVWVKLGHYRWWPGIVLHPTEIPDNIWAVKHSPGEFVVRFFGQYDHYWVNRGRVFPFQEGDSGKISSQKSKIDAAFTTAMEHAQRACEILKKMEPNAEEDMDIASSLLPPHYVKLKTNKPVGTVGRRDVDANSLTQCDCDPNQPDPCGPYTHCLNRMLLTECGPTCRAGDRCNNRAFEKRLYPRLAAYRTHMRGWGLRTLEDIKQGQFVIEYVGELIDMEEFRRRMCRKHEIRDENFYFLTLDKERMIDAGPKGNLARFMNHCCEPNCETQKWTVLGDVRVGLFALRDIPANSEVTFNYNLECAGIEKKRCLCGAKRCSGYIGAKPKQLQDDQPKKLKPPAKRTYKKRKPVEDSPSSSKKVPKIKIKPIKPRELTEIEKDVLIIKNATNGMSSDSEGSRLSSVDEKNPKALKRKRVSFSTEEVPKKAKLEDSDSVLAE